MRRMLAGVVLVGAACAGEAAPPATSFDPPPPTTTTAVPSLPGEVLLGGARPARLVLPPGWEPDGGPRALVVLLHGYTASGELQDLYLGVSDTGADLGYLTLTPDGTTDRFGNRFWNVTDITGSVDDVSYLIGLVDDAIAGYNVDPARVFIVGHSNGGFMANKLACEVPDRIAGIAAIAGGIFGAGSECVEPGRVLIVHGTEDGTVPYEGGALFGSPFLGAEDTAARWREAGGCGPEAVEEGPFDFDLIAPGEETTITVWSDCAAGGRVELWRMEGSGHIPGFVGGFRRALMERLLATDGG